MRIASTVLAGALAAALAACSPQSSTPGSDQKAAAPASPAPTLERSFASEVLITDTDSRTGKDETVPAKFFVSGDKMRIDIMDPVEGPGSIIITPEAAFAIRTERGRQVAVKLPGMQMANEMIADMPGMGMDFSKPETGAVQLGPCAVSGTAGLLYKVDRPAKKAGAPGETTEACVSPLGFPLEAKENGKVVFQTTKFTPGPQDAALFAPPAGMPVQDVGKMMDDAMKKIDPAALEQMKKAMEGAAK